MSICCGIAKRCLGAAESWCQLDHTVWITALAAHILRLLPPGGATKLELARSRDRVSTQTLDHVRVIGVLRGRFHACEVDFVNRLCLLRCAVVLRCQIQLNHSLLEMRFGCSTAQICNLATSAASRLSRHLEQAHGCALQVRIRALLGHQS